MAYLRNCWYIAAQPGEITAGRTLARTILNEPVAFYRSGSGVVYAVEDRCPHRYARLSMGRVKGELLECGYHGACFNGQGRCVKVPGQDAVPPGADIKGYPILEVYGFIWIWMGDPALATGAGALPAVFHIHDSDQWDATISLIESFPAYYELMNDNFFDLTHAQFVHPETLGGGKLSDVFRAARAGDPEALGDTDEGCVYQVRDDRIFTRINVLDSQLSPFFHQLLGRVKYGRDSYDGNLDWLMDIEWYAPYITLFKPFIKPAGAAREDGFYVNWQANIVTPETDSSCHYFYSNCQNWALGDADMNKMLHDGFTFAFGQDKVIIEGQVQRLGGHDFGADTRRVSFAGDQVTGSCRRVIKKLLEKEQSRPV